MNTLNTELEVVINTVKTNLLITPYEAERIYKAWVDIVVWFEKNGYNKKEWEKHEYFSTLEPTTAMAWEIILEEATRIEMI